MDRKELERELTGFKQECQVLGRPIEEMCLKEAYPGDISTSYFVEIAAPWVDELGCLPSIRFLFDVLFKTTNTKAREKVFAFRIFDNKNQLHCTSENMTHQQEEFA
jgi:hypothetical protein